MTNGEGAVSGIRLSFSRLRDHSSFVLPHFAGVPAAGVAADAPGVGRILVTASISLERDFRSASSRAWYCWLTDSNLARSAARRLATQKEMAITTASRRTASVKTDFMERCAGISMRAGKRSRKKTNGRRVFERNRNFDLRAMPAPRIFLTQQALPSSENSLRHFHRRVRGLSRFEPDRDAHRLFHSRPPGRRPKAGG